jgi:hypothetical protein
VLKLKKKDFGHFFSVKKNLQKKIEARKENILNNFVRYIIGYVFRVFFYPPQNAKISWSLGHFLGHFLAWVSYFVTFWDAFPGSFFAEDFLGSLCSLRCKKTENAYV